MAVTDDDTTPGAGVTLVESGGSTSVGEDGTTDTYTVALNTLPASDVTVTVTAGAGAEVNKSGGSAGASQTLTFTPAGASIWSTPQTITVSGVDDDIDNTGDARAVEISHAATSSDSSYTLASAGKLEVTIADDDTAGVTLSATAESVAEDGGTASYTVVLDSEPLSDVVITVAVDDDTAVKLDGPDAATDTTASEDLTFTPSNWSVPQTITLEGQDDELQLPAGRTAILTHEIGVGKGDGGRYTANTPSIADMRVTVLDDDTPTGRIGARHSGGGTTVSEDGTTTDTYEIRLWTRPAHDVTVTVRAGEGARVQKDTGSPGASQTFTFTPGGAGIWSSWQTITVTGQDDDIDNADDRRLVTLAHATASDDASFNNADAGDVVVAVTDDDTAGVTLSETTRTLAEDGATDTYTVVLDSEPLSDVVLTATSGDGTAVLLDGPDPATDTTASEALTFTPSNWNVPQTITLEAQDDDEVNVPDRTTTVTHAIASAADGDGSRYTPATPTLPGVAVTLTNDDRHTLTLTLATPAADEGDAGTRDVNVVVAKPAGSPAVSYSLCFSGTATLDTDGTQAAGEDYRIIDIDGSRTVTTFGSGSTLGCVGAGGTVAFAANVDRHSWRVRVFGETDIEPDETVIATLKASAALPATFEISNEGNPATHIIRDDDTPHGLVFTESGGGTTVSEDGTTTTDSYGIALRTEPTDSVTVTVTAGAGTRVNRSGGTEGASQTLTFTTANWNEAQTITVTGSEDRIDNAGDARTVAIGHATTSNDANYVIASAGQVSVTVTDNDTAGVTLTGSSGGTRVREDGSDSDTYTVVLDTEPIANVTVTVTAAEGAWVRVGSGAAAASATLTFTPAGSGVWDTPQTVTVTGVNDNDDNPGDLRTVVIGHATTSTDPNYTLADAGSVSATVTDDDPTVVTLARTGSGGIAEDGGTAEVTITLGRTLVAGESVAVPLSVTGPTVATHYTLGLKDNGGTGVSLDTTSPHSAQDPEVTLAGAGARTATLTLTAVANTDRTSPHRGHRLRDGRPGAVLNGPRWRHHHHRFGLGADHR